MQGIPTFPLLETASRPGLMKSKNSPGRSLGECRRLMGLACDIILKFGQKGESSALRGAAGRTRPLAYMIAESVCAVWILRKKQTKSEAFSAPPE